jgi:putative ABC transport system permease protein
LGLPFVVLNGTKKFSVSKELGASVSTIIGLISKDFVRLVVVAFAITTPMAWWAMQKCIRAAIGNPVDSLPTE